MELFLGVLALFFFLALYLVFFYSRAKKLSLQEKAFFQSQLKKISFSDVSEREKIISYDTLLHKIFQTLGYQGSFGEILKKNGKRIHQSEEIWKLHRLRNKLVHELFELDKKEGPKQTKKYEVLIKTYL